MVTLTETRLAALCSHPELWVYDLDIAMKQFNINTVQRAAMFLATCAHESSRFIRLQENLNYSAEGLLATFGGRFTSAEAVQYARQPQRIANHAYAKRGGNGDEASGDGWRYRGRGPIQITFKDSYIRCGTAIVVPLMVDPEKLLDPNAGALSAAWFWSNTGCNEVADEADFAGCCGIVNRGDRHKAAVGLGDRFQWLTVAQKALSN